MSYYKDNFQDYNGRQLIVNWSKELWDYHLSRHPEISNIKTASDWIRPTVLKPSLVMRGKVKRGKQHSKKKLIYCYYKEHSRYQDNIFFSKVVVGCKKSLFYVKTIFTEKKFWDYVVQEKKYNNFKEIWRDPKSYL